MKNPRETTKTSRHPANTPGRLNGHSTRTKAARGRAQALRGGEEIHVDLAEHRKNGQHHERQHQLGHPDGHAERIPHEGQGLPDEMDPLKQLVDHSAVAQQHRPRICPHKQTGPQGEDHHRREHPSPTPGSLVHEVGPRVSEYQANQCDEQRDLKRIQHRSKKHGRLGDRQVVCGRGIAHAADHHAGEGNEKRQREKPHARQREEPPPINEVGPRPHRKRCRSRPVDHAPGGRFHRTVTWSTTPARS